MDEKFFTPSRFRILSEIARKPRSASEIARAIGMSLPYVLAQISLLEAKDIITKKQIEHYKQVGKPKQYYHITKPIIRVTILTEGFGAKYTLESPSPATRTYFQLISYIPTIKQGTFSQYYWNSLKHFQKVLALALVHTTADKVEMVAITTDVHLDDLRKNISHQKITTADNKVVTFSCWVHTQDEFSKGLANKDYYYEDLLNRLTSINDPEHIFEDLKQ